MPAVDCPRAWFEEDGTTPRTFSVQFSAGEAIVDEPLGRYLVAQRIARTTRIILPGHLQRLVA